MNLPMKQISEEKEIPFTSSLNICPEACCHIVYRQSAKLFSSFRNWDPPTPSPAGECALSPPPPGSGGRGTLAGERGVVDSPNSDEGTYTVVLFIYTRTYFVPAVE